jgi:hypothetical protein
MVAPPLITKFVHQDIGIKAMSSSRSGSSPSSQVKEASDKTCTHFQFIKVQAYKTMPGRLVVKTWP